MKIKQIKVSARKSRNYQTYEMEEVIEIEDGDDINLIKAEAQARCRKACVKQIKIDKGAN